MGAQSSSPLGWEAIAVVSVTESDLFEELLKSRVNGGIHLTSHSNVVDALLLHKSCDKVLVLTIEHLLPHHLTCETALMSLVDCEDRVVTLVDLVIDSITRVCSSVSGLWVVKLDTLVGGLTGQLFTCIDNGVTLLCVESESKGRKAAFDPTTGIVDHLCDDGSHAPTIALVHVGTNVVDQLTRILNSSGFESCSYLGKDVGHEFMPFCFFTDFVELLARNTSLDSYEFDKRSSLDSHLKKILFDELHELKLVCVLLTGCVLLSPKTCLEYVQLQTSPPRELVNDCAAIGYTDQIASVSGRIRSGSSVLKNESFVSVSSDAKLINSMLLGRGEVEGPAVVDNCKLTGSWRIGAGSLCLNLDEYGENAIIPPNVVVQEVHLGDQNPFLVIYSLDDDRKASMYNGTYMRSSWVSLLQRTGIHASEIWDVSGHVVRSLETARIFPFLADSLEEFKLALFYHFEVFAKVSGYDSSLKQWVPRAYISPLLLFVSRCAWLATTRVSLLEIESYRSLRQDHKNIVNRKIRIDEFKLVGSLMGGENVDSIVRRLVQHRYWKILPTLDQVVSRNDAAAVDALSTIGDALVAFGQAAGGSSSFDAKAPANNPAFARLFQAIQDGDRQEVKSMGVIRDEWLANNPTADTLFRLARHYYKAVQLLKNNSE